MTNKPQKKAWNGKSKANGMHFSIFLFVLKKTGIKGAYRFLYLVAGFFFLFDWKSNRYIRYYYRTIWKFGRWKTLRYRFKMYYRFGQTILDKVAILAGNKDDFHVEFDGHDKLIQIGKEGKGAILISAHIGNWEIAGHFLKNANRPVNVIMYDVEHEAIKEVLKDSLKNRAFKIIQVQEDFSHLMEIKRALAEKEFICIHGDRILDESRSKFVEVDFLGKPVKIPRGPFELAVRFKVPHLFVFAIKETRRNYHFHAFHGRTDTEGDVEAMIRDYVGRMEQMLEPYPEQWFNFYDYWGEVDRPSLVAKKRVLVER